MMREWKTYKLKDAVYINPYVSLRKGTTAKKVSMDKLQSNNRYIPSYELAEYTGGAKFTNGDTIMARITPCLENGKIAQVGILDEGEVGFGSTEYIVFRAREGITDKDFVYSLVCSNFIREPAVKSMVGSSNRQRVQTDVVENLEIAFPPLNEQIKIAKLLRAFDDKIESNKRINDILQQQAQAIYCELTNGEFNACLGDLITEMPKSKIKVSDVKDTIGDYPFFTSGKAVLNYHTALVSGRKIYLNTGGNADVKYYIGDASYSTDTWCIEGKNGLTDFLYLAIYDYLPEIEQICFEGSALRHLQKAKLKSLPVCIPSTDASNSYLCSIKSLFDRQSANIQENKKLVALRDTLLPKLMSGEIDVSDVEI